MNTRTTRILSLILMILPALVLITGGVMKLSNAEPPMVVEFLTKAGFGRSFVMLGLGELLIAALFLYPKTRKPGFLLLSCYFGGALALELGGGQVPASALFLALAWTGMFLAHREVFLPAKKVQ